MAEPNFSAFAGDGPELTFRKGLEAGEFKIQKCNGCGKIIYYPRAVCNHCGAADYSWLTASGNGTVYSTSVERTPPDKGGDQNLAIIDLEEGARLMSRVVDIAPTEVKIGMKVKAFIGEIGDTKLILFRPA